MNKFLILVVALSMVACHSGEVSAEKDDFYDFMNSIATTKDKASGKLYHKLTSAEIDAMVSSEGHKVHVLTSAEEEAAKIQLRKDDEAYRFEKEQIKIDSKMERMAPDLKLSLPTHRTLDANAPWGLCVLYVVFFWYAIPIILCYFWKHCWFLGFVFTCLYGIFVFNRPSEILGFWIILPGILVIAPVIGFYKFLNGK